jgi:hypothetical protein
MPCFSGSAAGYSAEEVRLRDFGRPEIARQGGYWAVRLDSGHLTVSEIGMRSPLGYQLSDPESGYRVQPIRAAGGGEFHSAAKPKP